MDKDGDADDELSDDELSDDSEAVERELDDIEKDAQRNAGKEQSPKGNKALASLFCLVAFSCTAYGFLSESSYMDFQTFVMESSSYSPTFQVYSYVSHWDGSITSNITEPVSLVQNFSLVERVLVVSAFKDESRWIRAVNFPAVVYARVPDIPGTIFLSPNEGNEAHTYLRFIVDHYEVLPKQVLFVHGHDKSWHNHIHKSSFIPRLRWNKEYSDITWKFHQTISSERHMRMMALLWDYANCTAYIGPQPTEIKTHCCAEFFVSRERIHRHPRSFYVAVLTWLLNPPVWILNEPTRERGIILEYIWPIIFGESHILPEEKRCDIIVC